jgi:hypothetical protein
MEPLSKESTVANNKHVNPLKRKSLSKRKLELENSRLEQLQNTTSKGAAATHKTPNKLDRSNHLMLNRSRTMSPRLPLGNIPSAANASSGGGTTNGVNFSSPNNRSRSTTITQSVNKENTTTTPVEMLSKRFVQSVNPSGAQQPIRPKAAEISVAPPPTLEDHRAVDETTEDKERERRCDTERIARLTMMSGATAPSPILNASITAKRLTKQRVAAAAASSLSNMTHQQSTHTAGHQKSDEPCSVDMDMPAASSKRVTNKQRLHSTYIEEDKMLCASPVVTGTDGLRRMSRLDKLRGGDSNHVINSPNQAAFDLSMRRKSGNLSVMTHDVEQLMDEGGALDPDQDEIVQGSGAMYQAALMTTSTTSAANATAATKSAAKISSATNLTTGSSATKANTTTRSASATATKDASSVYDFEVTTTAAKNTTTTKRSTRSTSNADKSSSNGTSTNNQREEPEKETESSANKQPSKSSIVITKVRFFFVFCYFNIFFFYVSRTQSNKNFYG